MSTITVVGNLVNTPEVRFTPSGNQMTTGTVVENHGYKDKSSGDWVESEPTFWPFVMWGEAGTNLAESLSKGDRVVVIGDTRTNTWEDKDTGVKRARVELTVREFGASLRFARARLARRTLAEQQGTAAAASDDAWATPSTEPAPF